MTRPGTFERVYAGLKERLRLGSFQPGDRLEPAVLSEELNASVTPVRDALHRLTGERLVEAPRHEGFRVPLLTETMLRHLYAWHRDLVTIAILNRQNTPPGDEAGGSADPLEEPFERQNGLFLALVRRGGNPEHIAALEGLMTRLQPVQRFEGELLDALEPETEEILVALRTGNRTALKRSLKSYHRRRARIVPLLIERLYAAEGRTSEAMKAGH